MKKLREAARHALLALKRSRPVNDDLDQQESALEFHKRAITGLESVLVEMLANDEKLNIPEERVKEFEKNEHEAQPVAWWYHSRLGNGYFTDVREPPNPNWREVPLYMKPQQRKPLTDEQIEYEWERITGHSTFGGNIRRPMFISPDEVTEFARAIEAAHGIKE